MISLRWLPLGLACLTLSVQAETLQEVTVTAAALGETPLDASQPVSVLRGPALERRRSVSLGDTLDGLPGVSSSGSTSGRPVIRGFAGPRVGITENGLDTLDASSLSPDHAVAADPLAARQIEVLRGPATLLYGSGASGGLVNVVTDLIPTEARTRTGGELLLGHDSAAREGTAAFRLTGGLRAPERSGGLNWTLGGLHRDAGDYRIPETAVRGDPTSASGRLPGSASAADSLSGGLSWTDRWGVAGFSYSSLDSRYGIPAEPSVAIDLRNRRTEGLLELDEPLPGLSSLRLRGTEVRYRHAEFSVATGAVGTAFDSVGRDLRLEALHTEILRLRGVFGAHVRQRDLSAQGEEAYLPSARESEDALFWVAERALGPGRIEFGLRQAQARRTPEAASGQTARRFDPRSFSLGGQWPLSTGITLLATAAAAQRAPAIEELYAQGAHAATRTYELGDAALATERSRSLDLALRGRQAGLTWKFGGFERRFANYIAGFATDINGDGVADRVDATGTVVNSAAQPDSGEFGRLAYQQAGARFRGLEAELSWSPAASPWRFSGMADAVRGTVDGLGAAPRTPPLRIGATVDLVSGPWAGFVSVLRAADQNRTGPFETATPGYTRVDAELSYRLALGANRIATFFVQGRNLTNQDIRLATSYVKDLVPLPGRSVWAGLRVKM